MSAVKGERYNRGIQTHEMYTDNAVAKKKRQKKT